MTSIFHGANYSRPSGPVHPPTQVCRHPQTSPDFMRASLQARRTHGFSWGTKASLC